MDACPVCGSRVFLPRYSARRVQREIAMRSRFVLRRFDYKPAPAELMDLTRFMHGGPARILACSGCGLLLRDEPGPPHYETDIYDPDLLAHLYPRYLEAFRRKRAYREWVPEHTGVIELGSHLGAFLEIAEEWNWRAVGLDIGESTSAFARRRGLDVRRESLDSARLRERSAGAVFIWNCFEQIEDPQAALRRAYGLLQKSGILVVRVPDAAFYESRPRASFGAAAQALAYNNLLGFPYRFGYRRGALERMLAANGFEPLTAQASAVIALPFPDLDPRMIREAERATSLSSRNGEGPWLEIVARKIEGAA